MTNGDTGLGSVRKEVYNSVLGCVNIRVDTTVFWEISHLAELEIFDPVWEATIIGTARLQFKEDIKRRPYIQSGVEPADTYWVVDDVSI